MKILGTKQDMVKSWERRARSYRKESHNVLLEESLRKELECKAVALEECARELSMLTQARGIRRK